MAKESSEVRVFGDGGVYLAEVGTAFPTTASASIASTDWANLGFLTEAGPEPMFGQEEKEIGAWQSSDPVRSLITKRPKSVKFELLQTNRRSIIAALGGGTVTESAPASGLFKYEPPAESTNKEWAMIVEGIDGTVVTRICYRRVKQVGEVKFSFVRDDATKFGIEMKVLTPSDNSYPFQILTNDENFGDAGLAS